MYGGIGYLSLAAEGFGAFKLLPLLEKEPAALYSAGALGAGAVASIALIMAGNKVSKLEKRVDQLLPSNAIREHTRKHKR